MKIVFTDHFMQQFEMRRQNSPVPLTWEVIKDTIQKPDITMPDPEHPSRVWLIKKIEGRCLKIIMEVKGDEMKAITVFFDRGLRRKGLCK